VAKRAFAGRYSQAVFEIALEKGELESWQSDLEKIASLSEDAEFAMLLENPKVPFSEKAKLLSAQLGDVKPLAINLVHLLVAKGRFAMASEIADEYQRLLDSYKGIEKAEVTTAIPLDDKDKAKLEERLGTILDKQVVISSQVDSELVGGVVARVSGKLIDGSTRSRLEALKKELSGSTR